MDLCKHNKNDFDFEMVNHHDDDGSTINNNTTITTSCQLLDTSIEDATNNTEYDGIMKYVPYMTKRVAIVYNDSTINDKNTTITTSCQFLDTSIEDATDNKKTVDSTMEAVILLMKQVDSTEKAAEQAKEEATRSTLHILAKVEELKQARQCAKETNYTHAKEVYAQKVVLDTKVKELQCRVSGVLSQGGTSLGVLDEMRRALEKRMTSALKKKELADEEKLEKESWALEVLADEEIQMKKVEEESERLKQEELQQFLADRGHVVDMLDGDISGKCKDVNLLKESLDEVDSLSEVLSSSQISSIVSERSSLTNDISNETNEPADYSVLLEKRFSFVLNDSAVKNVQSATQKQSECGKSVALVVPQEHELLSKISNLNLEKHEGNKDVSFKADKKDEQVAEITKLGHAMSTEGFVASAQTHAEQKKKGSGLRKKVNKAKKRKKSNCPRYCSKKDCIRW